MTGAVVVASPLDFSSIKLRHQEIYDKISNSYPSLSSEEKIVWLNKSKSLIDDLKEFAAKVNSVDDYYWLETAVFELDEAFSLIIDAPEEILEILEQNEESLKQIEALLNERKTSKELVSPLRRTFSRDYLEKIAYQLSEARKLEFLEELRRLLDKTSPSDLKQFLDYLSNGIPQMNSEDQIDRDWLNACVYFSLRVLDGRPNLSSQVQPDLYHYLEEVWLEDVQRLKAYQIWCTRNRPWQSELFSREADYFRGCEEVFDYLFDSRLKTSLCRFKDLEDYLKNRWLSESGHLLRDKFGNLAGKSRKLVEIKSYYLWKKLGIPDEQKNWSTAVSYVENFYGNIIPAIKDNNSESIARVKAAILSEIDPNHRYIVNCFELALIAYFVK